MPQPPSDVAPIVDATGRLTQPWRAFFAGIFTGGGSAVSVAARQSPATYKAPSAGTLILFGAVDAITITRGRDAVEVDPSVKALPMASGDTAMVTYSTVPPPNLTFLPT
ncbi:hypothetical protein [Methylobacterium sp. yr596]|uniref:hypothetical protein n=1 Tax=Methylobacterium sp. yr596 TaxID=1761800 RepID=UPI0008EEBD52|nr:hypothetical protein [Methylobacterium sp. yr596]SFF76730.1 hypothetical protein SAMN04487844_14711 [Methylobacterium sp. yr596]